MLGLHGSNVLKSDKTWSCIQIKCIHHNMRRMPQCLQCISHLLEICYNLLYHLMEIQEIHKLL